MKAHHPSRILLAAIPLAGIALAAVPAAAATGTHAVHVARQADRHLYRAAEGSSQLAAPP